jgi:hypothetical protein
MKKIILVLLVVVLLTLLIPLPILASASDMPVPDSALSISSVYAYENVLVSGDQLFVAHINIPYGTTPTLPSSSTFLGRIISDAGVDEGDTPVISYYDNGYTYNTMSVYFPTAVVPWNTTSAYTFNLTGSPTLNWLGTTAATTMSGAINNAAGDETVASNNATANDMTLPAGTLNQVYYFGSVYDFNKLTVDIGTPGAGVWTVVWEYWNGNGWAALTDVLDGTSDFMAPVGNHDVTFTIPSDWASHIVSPVATSQMWVRARVSSSTSVSTPPLGTQAWVNGNTAYPTASASSVGFTWRTSATVIATQVMLYNDTIAWADTLGAYWNQALTTLAGNSKVLSTLGQTYFPEVIPNLTQMCPNLFITNITNPVYVQKTTNTSAASQVLSTWPFDWSGISHWLGFTGTDTAFRGLIAVVLIMAASAVIATKVPGAGMGVGWAAMITLAAIGWITPVLCAGILFMMTILFGVVFMLGRPSGP